MSGQSSSSPVAGATAVRFSGPADGAVVGKRELATLAFGVSGAQPAQVTGTLDGTALTFAARTDAGGDAVSALPGPLTDGPHALIVQVTGATGDVDVRRTFSVDSAAPKLEVGKAPAGAKGQPLTISGTVDAGATVTANGAPVTVSSGQWHAEFPTAPAAVHVVASDAAGNSTTAEVPVQFAVPVTRAVHMTGYGWGARKTHDAAMALLRAHKINAIEVDIKDEDGRISYASQVPMALTVGAVDHHYTPAKMLAEVHAAGGRVIGRLVAFKDPTFTKWAWTHGHHEMVLQNPDGTALTTKSYGVLAFPNFSNAVVQKYNVDLAVEAAKLGFDDVLYDYVRRPDKAISKMRIPGLVGTPEKSVASFVATTKTEFQKAGLTTYLGVSVFGIAATRPTEIAQDVSLMAPYVDYVSPMVYPSHWGKGEYKVADPNRQPYEIVQRSLVDFKAKVAHTNAAVIPWLQDFSLHHVKYGPDQLRAQFKGAADDGLQGFLLWNANCVYTGAALSVMK